MPEIASNKTKIQSEVLKKEKGEFFVTDIHILILCHRRRRSLPETVPQSKVAAMYNVSW